jgi:multicomponent Na+:H+ antiporter subunit E
MLLLNVLIALGWMALQSSFRPVDFLVGFAIGFVIIAITQTTTGRGRYASVVWFSCDLVLYMLAHMLGTAFMLMLVILGFRRGVVQVVDVPLHLHSDTAIAMLGHLISMSPGTLSLELSEDRRTLLVNVVSIRDVARYRQQITNELESRVALLLNEH